jgi:peptidyl-prolyl cis-trans isomerase SurA
LIGHFTALARQRKRAIRRHSAKVKPLPAKRPAGEGRDGRPGNRNVAVLKLTKNFTRIGFAALAVGLFAAAAQGQEQPGETASADAFNIPENITILGENNPNLRKATATVNGTIITGTDVDQRVALIIAANGAQPTPEELQRLRLQVFRNLIDETLQIQEATTLEMAVTPEEVDEEYNRFAVERSGSVEALAAQLAASGSSPASLKRQIEGEMSWQRLLRRNIVPFVNVSAEEVNELYERVQASRGEAEYRIGEIFLSATPVNRQAVATNAQRIVEQLRQGGSFPAYARQFSESSTASVGGDLGWIKLEQLQNPTLEQAARELNPGQLVGPIEIPGGFDILYLIDKRQVGMADPRDAMVSLKQVAVDFPEGMSEDQRRAKATEFAQAVEQIHGCGEAEAVAATIDAQVVSNDQMSVRQLPDPLQNLILSLNVGQATQPFGSLEEGVRVLMLCGRDDPQTAAGPDREQIAADVQDDRVNKRAQRYLRDLRRDAVIEYN